MVPVVAKLLIATLSFVYSIIKHVVITGKGSWQNVPAIYKELSTI